MDITKIGAFIKEQRLKKEFTQTELSEVLGVSHQAVSRWENGENLPDVIKLNELSLLFGVTVDHIIKIGLDQEFIDKNNTNNLGYFVLINSIFTVISVFLYYLLLIFTKIYWIPTLTQYILVIGSSLLYLIPYANIEMKTAVDFSKVRLGLMFTLGSLFFTLNTFISVVFYHGSFEEGLFLYAAAWGLLMVPVLYIANLFLKYYEDTQFGDKHIRIIEYFNSKILKYILLFCIGLVLFFIYGFTMGSIIADIDKVFFDLIINTSILVSIISALIVIKRPNLANILVGIANIILCYHLINIINISNTKFLLKKWSVIEELHYYLTISTFFLLFLSIVSLIYNIYMKKRFDKSYYLILGIFFTLLFARLLGVGGYFWSSGNTTDFRGVYYVMGLNYIPLTIMIFIIISAVDYGFRFLKDQKYKGKSK